MKAIEIQEAGGNRFIVSTANGIDHLELAQYIRQAEELKEFWDVLPDKFARPIVHRPKYSHEKAVKVLGMEFTPIETSVRDMAKGLIELGIVPSKK